MISGNVKPKFVFLVHGRRAAHPPIVLLSLTGPVWAGCSQEDASAASEHESSNHADLMVRRPSPLAGESAVWSRCSLILPNVTVPPFSENFKSLNDKLGVVP